uniref:FBD domain-containing protein n=1 Tax=Romanomermis culicivorax TaxID=13658 RepID=A0A915L038_ROMCU
MMLPKLKSLSLDIRWSQLDEDFNLLDNRIIKDLHFICLQNIEVYCGNFESHAKFVAFLLARSPLLKEFSLKPSDVCIGLLRTLDFCQ